MCFSLEWFLQLLIFLVVICGIIAILRIWIFPLFAAADPRIPATINIIIWVMVAIFVIYVCASLLMCVSAGGGLFPRIR